MSGGGKLIQQSVIKNVSTYTTKIDKVKIEGSGSEKELN